jgi:hypothetical protein
LPDLAQRDVEKRFLRRDDLGPVLGGGGHLGKWRVRSGSGRREKGKVTGYRTRREKANDQKTKRPKAGAGGTFLATD